jgi:hypothetical protein
MKQHLIILVFLFPLCPNFMTAQGNDNVNLVDLEYLYQGNRINVFDLRPREQEGTFYFSDEWMEGAVLYKNGKVFTDHLIRYNQKDNSIEVKSGIGILTLPGYYVKEFTMQRVDHKGGVRERNRFINPSNYNAGGYALNIGFLQEIYAGEMSLFSAHKAELVRPDHVPILSTGNTRARVIKRKKYFLYDGKRLVEIPRKRSKIIKLFEKYRPGISAYVKKEKLNVKSKKGLSSIIKRIEH